MTTTTRLRYLLRPREVTDRTNLQVLSVYRDYGVIPKESRSDNFNKTPEDITRYQEVRIGDLVVNKMKAWQGSLGISAYHGIVSPDYLVCSVDPSIDSRFMHHLLRSAALAAEFGARSKGIRPAQWRLYWEDLADIPITLPALEEQRRIAAFLDDRTAELERAAEAISRQAHVLDERYQAIVDSETGSYGESIPLKYASFINRRLLAEHTDPGFAFKYIDISSVDGLGEITIPEETILFGTSPSRARRLAPTGSTVVSTVRTYLRAIGQVPASEVPLVFSTGFAVVEAGPDAYDRYLAFACRSQPFINEVIARSVGVGYPAIGPEELCSIHIKLPALREQRRIADLLERETRRIGSLKILLKKEISRLAERRQALITAAVTGEITV